jgi:tol-pal system protein YbgF
MSCSFNGSVAGVVLAAAMVAAMPGAAAAASTSERLDSLERKLESRGLIDMLNRIEQLQRDVQQLRGNLEVQTHTLEDMQRRQREQYLDIDRRLQQLETGQVAGTPAGAEAPAVPLLMPPPVSSQPPAAMLPPVTSPPPVIPTEVQAPTAADLAKEQAEYDTALAILREGRYAEAAQAFNGFLAAHPYSSYADNANYWLGETYYVTRDFDRALQTFAGLVGNYPQSSKVSDSQLKMGYIYYEKQDWAAARRELESVVNNYPGSTTARLASDRLQRMKKEGH